MLCGLLGFGSLTSYGCEGELVLTFPEDDEALPCFFILFLSSLDLRKASFLLPVEPCVDPDLTLWPPTAEPGAWVLTEPGSAETAC